MSVGHQIRVDWVGIRAGRFLSQRSQRICRRFNQSVLYAPRPLLSKIRGIWRRGLNLTRRVTLVTLDCRNSEAYPTHIYNHLDTIAVCIHGGITSCTRIFFVLTAIRSQYIVSLGEENYTATIALRWCEFFFYHRTINSSSPWSSCSTYCSYPISYTKNETSDSFNTNSKTLFIYSSPTRTLKKNTFTNIFF